MKKRNLVLAMLCVSLLVLGMVSGANALSINPSSPAPVATTDINSNLDADGIEALLASFGVVSGDLTELYKQDVGAAADVGPFASSYTTQFFNTPADPADARITYVGGPYISNDPTYLYVKDGNQTPAAYVFDISTWNGTDLIDITGFWPQRGAISHVTILGGPTTNMPEPTTLLLLGLGLVGMAGIRRKLR